MTRRRLGAGFGYGIVATIAMSILMLMATVSGVSPMPEPIPKAVVVQLFGSGIPKPMALALAVGLHLGYGGLLGTVLARVARPVTVRKGVAFGTGLWALMQLAVLPLLGWGVFGTAVTPRIAAATLVLHLVYGAVLGWAMDRDAAATGRESPTIAG